jgi:hypothetical protein
LIAARRPEAAGLLDAAALTAPVTAPVATPAAPRSLGVMRLSLPKKKETSVAASPPWMQEVEAFNNLEFADLEYAPSRDHSTFYSMV